MRTTVDINPDLLKQIRKRADDSGLSFREALNQVIQRGLRAPVKSAVAPFVMPDLGFRINPSFNVAKATSLAFEMEDDAMLRKMGYPTDREAD